MDYAGSIGNTEVSPEMAHPHWKANTAFGYSIGPVSAAVHWRYIAAMKHQDGNKPPPFVSGQPLTTDTATYDIIGRTYYVGFKARY